MGSNCCKCANDKKNKHLTSTSSNSSGPWTRGDVELIGERFTSTTQRGAVTLNVRNATVDDSGRYSLSVRNDAGHAHSDLLLEVRTRPGDVPVFLRRLNDLAVKVGTRTRFLVEIRSPTQVKVSWEQEGKPVVESERFHLLHEGNFFCVDVAPVTLGDAGLWICRAHNANGSATCFCQLNVLVPKAYKAPHFIEELVAILTEQGTVSLECKVVGVPTPTLRWFKDNQEIKAGDVFALSANPQDTTSLGTYTCEATNCMGRALSTSRVHVLNKEGSVQPVDSLVPKGPAPVFSKELRNDKVKIGGKLTLSCKVSVPPWPKSITWFNKGGQVENGSRYHILEDGLGAYSVEVDPVEAVDEGEWKCVATSSHGVKGISTCSVSVSYPKNYKKPKFLESLKAILTEEGLVSFECKVVGYPTPQLRWFKDGQELKPGDVYQLTGTNSLGSYCCIAKNCMGETSSTAELTVEDIQSQLNEEERLQLFRKNQPPHFLQGLKSLEAKIMDPLRFTVQVSVSPQPSVAWFRDDEEVQETDRYKKEQETTGFCHLVIKRLDLVDQAEWKCVATNDYGQSVTSCFLKLQVPRHYKKPRFLENLRAVLSEEGAVNLECKVIGVPQPTLKWYKDGRELKPGDIHRIISGQDGTCCLGTYTCEATNCMGTVASSASLLGFEDRAQVKPQPEPLRPLPPPAAHLQRHPSLSTILEERTSQLHDTVATDERAEVSFSFDGKEVSVSLYETPDLTEEEALQVVEMYAEELSEHISGLQEVKSLEHNVVELPPMRFVKETSQSGHLLMEAVVIDVSPEYYASAEDRTEADLDEFSITEDNGFMSPQVLTPEEMPFDKFTADFLERTSQLGQKPIPVKPPRKRGADNSESSYHSLKEAKLSPEEESSEFADALSSIKDKSQKDSFSSAKSGVAGLEIKPSDKMETTPDSRKAEHPRLSEKDDKQTENKKQRKKSRSRSRSAEIQSVENVPDTASEKKLPKRPLKKRKSTDSEREDDSLREFEKQKSLKSEKGVSAEAEILSKNDRPKKTKSSESEKEDDSLQEFESRKSIQRSDSEVKTISKSKTIPKRQLSDSSGREDDSLIEYEKKKDISIGDGGKATSLKSDKTDRQKKPLSKSISTDSSEKDDAFAINSEQSDQLRKRKKRSIKKSGSTEKKTDTPETGVEIPPSSEAESCDRDSLKNRKVVSSSDLDRMRSTSDLESIGDKSRAHEEEDHSADFDTAEDSAYDKSEMSVLESLTHSIKEIKKGLAAVEERVISESTDEPLSAKSSLSAIESLVQPINEIQRGLLEVEKLAEESEAGQYSPSSILETLKDPIQELGRNLAEIEKAKTIENVDESLLKRTSQTLLEAVSHPLHELQKELNFIQQQAKIETGEETYSDVLQSFKPSLLVVQGGVEQTEGDFTSKLEDLTDVTVLPQGTYAQPTEQSANSKELGDTEALDIRQDDSFVPLTVLDVEESLAETATSLTTQGAFDLQSELGVFSGKLKTCLTDLSIKAMDSADGEIKDILVSLGKLTIPLEQFKNVIEKCLKLVGENEKSNDPQLRSSNMVLKATLESPVHALGKCINLLDTVASSKSNKEIRGLGIKILYKLSFPLEELKTTMKLIENLSEHTSIELLVTPVENLISAASVINLDASKSGFAENIPQEGGFIVKELSDTVRSLSKSVTSISKALPTQSSLCTLTSLTKSLVDFQKSLNKMENTITTPEMYNTVTTSDIYNLAQDLCKPLQAFRTELSIAQHEIELDQYSHLSLVCDPVESNTLESASNIIHQSLEQVHKSVLTCTEFVLSKSPSETLYVRYLLFALNELILPLNQLNVSVTKANESLSETYAISEPNIGITVVTSAASELLSVLTELRQHSLTAVGHPEIKLIKLLCTMEEPLMQVESGLCKIIEHNHGEDKNVLNINMLKTLAEPFKCLQKSLIDINEKLGPDSASQGIFLELRNPIQELQRSILIIQDQVSFEYGDEPASMESNIITLQSLVHPLNSLKKQFMELDDLMIDKTQSTSYSRENKNLHSIIKVNHEIQLKLSSIMVEENYLNKHSLDSLDMFPIFQDLNSLLRDFENSLRRVDLICSNERKADVNVYNKLCEAVRQFNGEAVNFRNKIRLASNKAIKDVKHPVHFLKKGTETFITNFSENALYLNNCQLDEQSMLSCSFQFYQSLLQNLKEFSEFIMNFDKTSEEYKDSTEMSIMSSSDTIKDIETIMEEVSQTRVSLESLNIVSCNKINIEKARKEVKIFCELLKTTEDNICRLTSKDILSSQDDERKTLVNTLRSMTETLNKIDTCFGGNDKATESVNSLKNTLEMIQEHLEFGGEISEPNIFQRLCVHLKNFKDNIFDVVNQTGVKNEETPVSSYLERFERSASDLELGLMKLEHALLNSTGDFSSLKNIDIDVLAHPIEELVCYITNIEERQTSFDLSESLADQSSLTMLKTLAQPIREIQEGVILIQEQIALEASGKTPSGKSCAGILYEIAKPIRELRSGVALIQEQMVLEPDVEPLSEETRASSIQTFAVPIEEMKKVLTTITEQQPLLFEGDAQSISENISLLKTIAQPVRELQNKLASIEINQIMDSGVEPFSVKQDIIALAKPVQTLQEGIAMVESQLALETTGDDLSLQESVSMLKKIAKPLMEISKGIAIIFEQQYVEEGDVENVSTFSDLSTLANLTDVTLADAAVCIDEKLTLEHGLLFQEESVFPQVADTTVEDNRQIGITEQQQVLIGLDDVTKNKKENTVKLENLKPENTTLVIQEVTSGIQVVEQEALSQVNTLTFSEERTLKVADNTEEALNVAVLTEFQDPIVQVENLSPETIVEEIAVGKEISLNIAAQVDEQVVLSDVKGLTSIDDMPITNVEPNTLTPCIVQGELQQSLADVESLETEEETLESLSIQETSFKYEPQINDIQETLSNVGDLVKTEKTLCEAEMKTGITEAVQSEIIQTLDKEANLKSVDMSSEEATMCVNSPNIAGETEIQQVISNFDDIKTVKHPSDSANIGEVSLLGAVQVEFQQTLSDAEPLKTESVSEKYSQAIALEESHINVAVKTQVQEFFSVAEQIQEMKNEIQVIVTNEPLINESAKQEVRQVIQMAEDIVALKEAIQTSIKETPDVNIDIPDIKEVLRTCEKVKEVKDIIVETIHSHDEIKAEKSGSVTVSPIPSEPKLQKESSSSRDIIVHDEELQASQASIKHAIEIQLEKFMTAVENVSDSVNRMEAKLARDPAIKFAAQQECQEVLCSINDFKTARVSMKASEKQETPINLTSEIEIQQVLLACKSFEKLQEIAEATVRKELKVCKAIEVDLYEILSFAETFKTVKQSLVPNITTTDLVAESENSVSTQVKNVISSEETEIRNESRVDDEVQYKTKGRTFEPEKEIDKPTQNQENVLKETLFIEQNLLDDTTGKDITPKDETSTTVEIDKKTQQVESKESEKITKSPKENKAAKEKSKDKLENVKSKEPKTQEMKEDTLKTGKEIEKPTQQQENLLSEAKSPETPMLNDTTDKALEHNDKKSTNLEINKKKQDLEIKQKDQTKEKISGGKKEDKTKVTEEESKDNVKPKEHKLQETKDTTSEYEKETEKLRHHEENVLKKAILPENPLLDETTGQYFEQKEDKPTTLEINKEKQEIKIQEKDRNNEKISESHKDGKKAPKEKPKDKLENMISEEPKTQETKSATVESGKKNEKLSHLQENVLTEIKTSEKTLLGDAIGKDVEHKDEKSSTLEINKKNSEVEMKEKDKKKTEVEIKENDKKGTEVEMKGKDKEKTEVEMKEKDHKKDKISESQKEDIATEEKSKDELENIKSKEPKERETKRGTSESEKENEKLLHVEENVLTEAKTTEKGLLKEPTSKDLDQKDEKSTTLEINRKKQKVESKKTDQKKENISEIQKEDSKALEEKSKDKLEKVKVKEPQKQETKGVSSGPDEQMLPQHQVSTKGESPGKPKDVTTGKDKTQKDGKSSTLEIIKTKEEVESKGKDQNKEKISENKIDGDRTTKEKTKDILENVKSEEHKAQGTKSATAESEKETEMLTHHKENVFTETKLPETPLLDDLTSKDLEQNDGKPTTLEISKKLEGKSKGKDKKKEEISESQKEDDKATKEKSKGRLEKVTTNEPQTPEIGEVRDQVKLTKHSLKKEDKLNQENENLYTKKVADIADSENTQDINHQEKMKKIEQENFKEEISSKTKPSNKDDNTLQALAGKKSEDNVISDAKVLNNQEESTVDKSAAQEETIVTHEKVKREHAKSKTEEVKIRKGTEIVKETEIKETTEVQLEKDLSNTINSNKTGESPQVEKAIENSVNVKENKTKQENVSEIVVTKVSSLTPEEDVSEITKDNEGELKEVTKPKMQEEKGKCKKDEEQINHEKDQISSKSQVKPNEIKSVKKSELKKGKQDEEPKIKQSTKEITETKPVEKLIEADVEKSGASNVIDYKSDKYPEANKIGKQEEGSSILKSELRKDATIEEKGEPYKSKADIEQEKTQEHTKIENTDHTRKTAHKYEENESQFSSATQDKSSLRKKITSNNQEAVTRKRSPKKQKEEPVLDEIKTNIQRKSIGLDTEGKEKLLIVEKEEDKYKPYLDESSTSDYGSESYSEPYQIKKSQSYDTRQWVYDSKSAVEETAPRVITKRVRERKHEEVIGLAEHEKVAAYTSRQSASKPLFCGRLVDRTAAQGSRLKVTCSLTGTPDPTVQWFKDGHPLDTAADHRLRTRLSNGLASLEIAEAKVGDSGRYTCTARNTHGEATSTANIKVFSYLESAPEAPVFTQHIRDHYKSASDELVIECRVKGHPQPTVTWTKDGQAIRPVARYEQSLLTDGTCRLVVHGPEPSDSGLYKCAVENAVWSEQTSAHVTFEGREKYLADRRSLADPKLPRFTNIVTDTVVREGGTVALQVAVKGTPRAEVTWYRGTEPLPKRSSRFRYLEDAGIYSLVMTEASVGEAGTYTCRASNAYGYRDTSVNVEIVGASGSSGSSRGKPAMFLSRPDTSMAIAVGEDVSVSFRVSGDPKPRVTWMKGMKDITNNIRALKETVNDYVRLTLKHATVMDAGTYFIMAKNIYGADHAFVTVRVKQRARSLTPTRTTIWSGPDTSTILRDIHESTRALVNDVPGPVSSEPVVSDCGKNWLSLSWGKPDHRGAAPVLAYRVEAWLLGTEGGAQWTELGVTPINSFDVFFLKPGSEYKFRVTARNRYGWGESVTTSESISIGNVANFPPDIVRDLPGPLKALQGDNVTLECEISADPEPTIQWLKDGHNVGTLALLKDRVFVSDDRQTHRLIVKQLTEDDSGRYVCEAVNKLGRASTYARLLVCSDPRLLDADRKLKESLLEQRESAPQFTMRLRDRRVQASYPVRLSCQVVGSPTPSVTWACQGQPITDDDRHQIVQEADHFHTLEICRTLLEDSGEYTATAQNCLGAVSCHCQLVVDKGIRAYISPEFTSELGPAVTVKEGAELRLFAQVEAYPTVSISWQRDGVRLRPSRRLVMTLDPEGRVELALAHLEARDAGLYTCTATNAVGRAETVCQVFVTGGNTAAPQLPSITASDVPYSKEPRFVTKPRSSEAVEGDTVIITCEVVGDPQPEVMWLRDWLKPGYYRDAPQFRLVGGGSQYSLEIPQVKLDFTGTYCVIARNPHGETKAIISLQIFAKGQGKESSMVSGHVKHGQVETLPEIKRELRDVRCCDGDAVTLECLVSATPLPSVRWEKDGKILPLGEDIEAELDGEIARLTIKKVYPEDEGQYSCVAYNNLGRAVTSACLVVDVPEEKDTLLSQQLTRPPGLLSARSTPRSTPRNTPSPARSLSPTPARYREFSSPTFSRPKRVKMSSPKFYTVPHNRIAEEGETVRFQCSVAGHPTPWASWDKDGHIVTPSSRLTVSERDDLRTLELREVTVEDAGLYRVTLENEMGSVEATARLDIIGRQGSRTRSVRAWSAVRSSPTFGRRLVGSAARVGGTFTLTCDVHASPSPVTSWYRNGDMLVKSPRVVPSWDGRRARLELRGLQPEDAGVYTCVAENAVGTTQCSAELRVLQTTDPSDADLQPPVFLQGLPPEQTAAEGQPFELQVRLQGSSPLEVVWVKDGVEVPDCPDLRHVDYGDGRFGLRIADVFTADGGIYNCEAFNDHGDAITSGHLIVNDLSGGESGSTEPEIMFTKTPSPVLARLRGQASFCARLQSRPLSHTSFTWTVNGHSVNNDDRFTVTTEDDCSVLHVAEVCPSDMGPVVCTARVCSPAVPPTTVSCDTTLALDPSPGAPAALLRGPCDTTAMRGDRVLLKATYRGDPEPSVRWLKAGRELSSEGRVQITSRDGVSCLTISAIDADDSGKYVVSVENIHGADCHFASVAVEGPPEAPAARPSVSAAGQGCVTVAWSSPPYDGGCVITGYRVEMRTALSHQWSVVADRCHSLSHVVRGLTPGQTYLFRVRAENIHGASESSAESLPFMLQTPHTDLREDEGEGEGESESDAVLEPKLVTLEPGDQFLERYSVHEELGKGRYGVVHKVTDLRTGHTMAAKFVRCIKKQDREKVQEEIDIMNCLRHPKLLQLAAAFDNPKDMVMVMEYISGGELFERVVADDFTLTERDCILFLRQICEGVRYMHTCNVVHLDLKPENIMCHTRTSHRVKIIDFGLAQKLQTNTPVRVLFGTPEFIPPEIINYEPIGVESDMWSVGVICYVLLSGLSPFMGDNDAETFANITRADFDFDDEAFEAISQDAKDFISSLLVKRKEKRLTAEECLKHKWLTQSDTTMSSVKLCTDKLKKFIIRRKWQRPPRNERQIA